MNTAAMLEDWQQAEDVVLAGLCHALIGPSAHVQLSALDLETLLIALDTRTVQLIALFTVRYQTRLYQGERATVYTADDDLRSLAHLVLANSLEQMSRLGNTAAPVGLDIDLLRGLLDSKAHGAVAKLQVAAA